MYVAHASKFYHPEILLVHEYKRTYIHTCIHVFAHTHTHTHTHRGINIYSLIALRSYTHICIHTYREKERGA